MKRRLSRHSLACFLAWLICGGLYFGTANGVAVRSWDRQNAWHHYEYLTEGFLRGHTHLSRLPATELLALPDPYLPDANESYRLWDASLFEGKYYLYYGPAPAVTVLLPWKILTGHHLPQWAATAAFAIAGIGALALLMAGARKKYFPQATPLQLFVAVILVGHLTWLPVVLRRPAFWELPIVAAAALFWWSLFLFWKFQTEKPRPAFLFLTGALLALTLGCRPSYLPVVAIVGIGFLFRSKITGRPRRRLQDFGIVALPIMIGGIALLAYNYLRFGNVREFGNTFQLWGIDERQIAHFNPAHLGFNLRLYFFRLPEISPYFPFLRTVAPGPLPAGYIAVEEMPGLLFTMPAVLLGGLAWITALRRPPAGETYGFRALVAVATAGSLTSGVLLFCFAGACSRYLVEVCAGWSVLVGLGYLALSSLKTRSSLITLSRPIAHCLIVWTILCVWLASFEFRSYARVTQPNIYRSVAKLFNYPGAWLSNADRQPFGPVILDLRLAPEFKAGDTVILSTGRIAMRNTLILERLAPERIRLRLAVNDLVMIVSPVLQTTGSLIRVELHTPWLYPPTAHPYWNRFSDPDQRRRLQTVSVLSTEAFTLMHPATTFFDATRFEPFVPTTADQTRGGAWVERLTRLDPSRSVAGRDFGADQPERGPEKGYFPH